MTTLPGGPASANFQIRSADDNGFFASSAVSAQEVAEGRGRDCHTRSQVESGRGGGQLTECDAEVSIANDITEPSLPQNPSALVTSMASPQSNELNMNSACQRPPPAASVNAASLLDELPLLPPLATFQTAAITYPSFNVHPVSPTSASSPAYAHPELAQPTSESSLGLSGAYPSLAGSFEDSALAWNMSGSLLEFDWVYFHSSLLMRHANEPDCVAAIKRLQDIDAGVPVFATVAVGRYRRLGGMELTWAYLAAHQVIDDCERGRAMRLKWILAQEGRKLMDLTHTTSSDTRRHAHVVRTSRDRSTARSLS